MNMTWVDQETCSQPVIQLPNKFYVDSLGDQNESIANPHDLAA